MNSSKDLTEDFTSTSEEEGEAVKNSAPKVKSEPSRVSFEFRQIGVNFNETHFLFTFFQTGKSTKEGVLYTHNAFKFTKNNWSRDGTLFWYRCSAKKSTGCTATATIKRVEEEDEEGQVVVNNYLLEVSTPEVNTD